MTGAVHDASPESWSLPENATVSGLEYQPFSSGCRLGRATAVGGVASKRNVAVAGALFPAASAHWPETLAVPVSGPE
jgi:hypothetical protein